MLKISVSRLYVSKLGEGDDIRNKFIIFKTMATWVSISEEALHSDHT